MKLIIDIPDEMWEQVKDGYVPLGISKYLKNGTPYNPKGDLISREAINSEIEKRYCSKHCVVPSEEPYCPDNCPARFLKNIVKECPTVEHSLLPLSGEADNAYMRGYEVGKAEGILKAKTRLQGEWIYHDKLNMYYCKDCGLLEPLTKEEVEEGAKLPNFCEQCGADMRKGGDPDEENS